MKRFFLILTAFVLIFAGAAGCKKTSPEEARENADMIAVITDFGDITDASYNQAAYDACKAFCKEQKMKCGYFKPDSDTDADRAAKIRQAIKEGFNILILPGKRFAAPIAETAPENPEIKFIALDVAAENYPDGADLKNVYSVNYREEIAGFMAGYAAIRLGYTKLGFLGGVPDDDVIRYGRGFVQGAEEAAKEQQKKAEMSYVYAGQSYGDRDITAAMERWYGTGTEIVFVCGDAVYVSAGEAAKNAGGKLIGADVDRKAAFDAQYGAGVTVTSAGKALGLTVEKTLEEAVLNGGWSNCAGQFRTLGIVDEDPDKNFVFLPSKSTQWSESFTEEDYRAMVKALADGAYTVSADPDEEIRALYVQADYQGTLKD